VLAGAAAWPAPALAVAPRARPRGGVHVAVAGLGGGAAGGDAAGGDAAGGDAAGGDAAGDGAAGGDRGRTDSLRLADALGVVDVAPAADAAWSLAETPARLVASVGATVARRGPDATGAAPADTTGALRAAPTGRVRVLATPGWEARFVVLALEAAGYAVDARLTVSPTARVTLGRPAAPTVDRYDAVVVLDTAALAAGGTATTPAALTRFVRAGGGLVVLGEAALALGDLAAARPGAPRPGLPGALRSAQPLDALPARELAARPADAVILARSARPDGAPLVVARRVGAGRVVQVAVRETWPWRMQGAGDAVAAHGTWWAGLVERASPAPRTWPAPAGTPRLPGDAAPYADLLARLGPLGGPRAWRPPSPGPRRRPPRPPRGGAPRPSPRSRSPGAPAASAARAERTARGR
jgi:hypothetical protein